MAEVNVGKTDEDNIRELSPIDQRAVDRALSLLANDEHREANKADLFLHDGGTKIWALDVGSVWIAFVEETNGDITVVHISLRSRFRYWE